MSESILFDIANYLSSVRQSYAGGIPIADIISPVSEVVREENINIEAATKYIATFYLPKNSSEEDKMLIMNSAEKGLKLSKGNYQIVEDEIVDLGNLDSKILISLTGQRSLELKYGKVFLSSLTPIEIQSKAENKRIFWEDLKKVLPYIK